ncbi:mechanosensitive ion channel family protein [Acetohalobium arabaticum]|uniref:MscS Mechanosensitive ion channel n=1 Tax=Acetohalobium arabaticum (strain ATCC 49924 / DSM 5501 / Z-7288) TaxID=574087 RepID=D9QSL0_ACEAZ|nr:mechanosensitive ion channel family protein [Acetohalobium arabaticum]ADL13473.1 MscS Mechanosensitive ion channel [Acetohalobium arabaticum DSM 5501]
MNKFKSLFTSSSDQVITVDLLTSAGIIILQLAGIFILSKILFKFINYLIENIFDEKDGHDSQTIQRNKTLKTILQSALRYLFYFVVVTTSLQVLGIPTASILAGAGVFGLAIGFGAQNLVEDIITGFFILFENQFGVGDYIRVSEVEGFVQEVGLRTTRIKNFNGDLHIIPNRRIEQVTNLTADLRRVAVDAAIEYEQNIGQAVTVLEDLCQEIKTNYNEIINEGPEVLGVQELAASSVKIRVVAMVEAEESWQFERVMKRKIKDRFDEESISIPYNHLTLVEK